MIEPARRRNNPRRLIGAEGQGAEPDQVGTPGDVGQLPGNLTDTDCTAAADIDDAVTLERVSIASASPTSRTSMKSRNASPDDISTGSP